MNFAQIATCAAVLMALSAQCAQAEPALATNNVNMRQGPGTSYPVVTTIPAGSAVEVSGCQGEWCSVSWHGQSGYSIATSLDQGGGPGVPPPGSAGQTPPPGAGGPPPPPRASAGGPYPLGAPPPGYPPPGYPPPGYPPPPGYYYPPGYGPYYYYRPYPYYGPYWRRRWWW